MIQNCQECDSHLSSQAPSFICFHQQKQNSNNQDTEKFKTKLCVHFMTTGKCFYGAKCHFAHGGHELRRTADSPPLIHPRHKTTLCQNELRHGKCKFGKGCMFIHREDPEYENLKKQMLDHKASQKHNEPLRNPQPASNPAKPTSPTSI